MWFEILIIIIEFLKIFFFKKNYLFILFLAVLDLHFYVGFSLVVESRVLLSNCSAQASHCGDFSCCGAQGLGTQAR